MEQQTKLVMPGDAIGVEEEYIASDNTYTDEGSIYSSIVGYVAIDSGKISVHSPRSEIKRMHQGMFVVGTITDDVGSVMFVKLDNIKTNGRDYLALRDGKIIAEKRGRFDRGGRDMGGRGGRPMPERKAATIGDVILARVIDDKEDLLLLGLRDRECGVIYKSCEECGGQMNPDKNAIGVLVCGECEHKEYRKISSLYNDPNGIEKLVTSI